MQDQELKAFLDEKVRQYNRPDFIASDPIIVPHQFSAPADIEISGFLAATIAWGQRKTILRNGFQLMELMDNAPADFILNFAESDLKKFAGFTHRTFNGTDCQTFLRALQRIYKKYGSLESCFARCFTLESSLPGSGLSNFRKEFFAVPSLPRTHKHVADPLRGSAAKRLNMFLRWMVRRDKAGVDFGIWKQFSPAQLYLPLDVHTANVSQKLNLLLRKQNDWKAVLEVTTRLRTFDPSDPVKYDFALFSLGVAEKF